MKLIAIGALAAAALASPAVAGDVTVTVSGVQPNGGPVLAVLQRANQFAKAQGAYRMKVEPTADTVTVVFKNVKAGTYAAAVTQDTNADGTVTIGATGPTEPFGFSGTPQTGAPKFGPASQRVTRTGGTMTVALTPPTPAPSPAPTM